MVVFAPMPSANVISAAAVNPGVRRNDRTAYRRSCARLSIIVDCPILILDSLSIVEW